MRHLVKLALAIKSAQIRNAEEFLAASRSPRKQKNKRSTPVSMDTSPTEEEQRLSERGVSFGDHIDLSVEPSTEYLN